MRTFLIIFITLIALGGGFALYVSLEDRPAKRPPKSIATAARAPRSATTQSLHGLGSVDNPWVKRFEKGELASQFRSERSVPRGGDLVEVTRPQAEFFTSDGAQRLRVEGATGEVIMPGGAGGGGGQGDGGARPQGTGNMSPPTRGRLQDVEISMFEPADAVEPMLVATMANAAFDNDTFRIATEGFTDASGKRIEADEVPVIVRGRDYDFTGRGLVIRWNQLDRKLQLLQVEHGESLTVKNLDALSNPQLTPAPATPATAPTARARTDVMIASADPRAVVFAAQPAADAADATSAKKLRRTRPGPAPVTSPPPPPTVAPTTRPKVTRDLAPVVYRASFESDIKIFEADNLVASAGQLEIDILQPPQEDPATKPAEEPDGTSTATTRAAKRDRRRADATSAPAIKGPITVKWTGKLRVVPLEGPRDPALQPGKALVRMTGAPVAIAREEMQARCGVLTFNSADGAASLRANEIVPNVTMTLGDGAKVSTPSLTYVQQPDGKRVATLVGASSAELAGEGSKGPLTLTWSQDGRIELIDLATGKSAIERADFNGDVKIVHPDLDMTGQTLSLGFDPSRAIKAAAAATAAAPQAVAGGGGGASGATPKTSPAPAHDDVADSLREIVATGNVNCRMRDGQEDRTIAGENLRVQLDLTPAGERYARLIDATGGVRTKQGDDEMEAGQLTAELAPAPASASTTQPVATVDASDAKPARPFSGGNARLVSLVAQDAVKLKTKDGSTAAAHVLRVENVNGREQYRLEGNPTATVTQGKTVISGPAIRFAPDEQIAEVIGVGGMKGTLPDDPKQSFDLAWAGAAVVNGATNLIDVTKQVVIKSIQEDGTVNTATSSRLQARLGPKPTTAPATAPAAAGPAAVVAATNPSQADKMNFLAGKEVTAAVLSSEGAERAEVKSELFAADGSLLRGLNLYAKTITTNRATGRLDVPGAGEMLFRDHRPPEAKREPPAAGAAPPAAPAPAKEGPTLGSGRGNTAFKWTQSLVYDDAQKQAVMTGDVKVVHHPMTKDGQPFNLWADSLTAQLEDDPDAKGNAQTANKPAADKQPKMRLKRVIANGNVKVESTRLDVDARELSYDPVAQVLHARGDRNTPITVFDKQKGTTSTASELEWNTATDQFHVKGLGGKVQP